MPQTTTPTPAAAKPQPPVPPLEFREGDIATMDATGLVRILTAGASSSEFQKAKACVRAGELGAKEAVPALTALLNDAHLSTYARYGLEPITDASAGEALRGGLSKLKGDRLIGVIHSLGKRRDAEARAALIGLMNGKDVDVARAAATAVGNIGGSASASALQAALAKSTGMTRTVLADALLICAERMLEEGSRDKALAVYTSLSAPETPKPARLAAMQAIITEETSVSRPR